MCLNLWAGRSHQCILDFAPTKSLPSGHIPLKWLHYQLCLSRRIFGARDCGDHILSTGSKTMNENAGLISFDVYDHSKITAEI